MDSDGDILRRSVAETEAFGQIFERHFDAVLAYARRRIGWSFGEEVASRVFVVAFERRASFDGRYASARPWLFGIATNLIRHHLRDERIHLAAIGRIPGDADPTPVDDTDRLDAQRLAPLLTSALLELSEDDRETFLLVALGELTYEQTALAIGIPIGTVRSRIHRARGLLRERIPQLQAISVQTPDRETGPWTNSS